MKKLVLLAVAGAGLALTGSTNTAQAHDPWFGGPVGGYYAPGISGYSVYSPGLYGYQTYHQPVYGGHYGPAFGRHGRHGHRGYGDFGRGFRGRSQKGVSVFVGNGGFGLSIQRFRY